MELKQVLVSRQSIRKYKKQQIDELQLEYILWAGMAAPISRKDYKSIKITVVQDEKLLEEMRKAFGEKMDPFYGAPTVIMVSSKQTPVKNIECLNVACVIENMLLAATDLGLGNIYLTSFLKKINNRELLERLGIEEDYLPLSAVAVGYREEPVSTMDIEEIGSRIETIRR